MYAEAGHFSGLSPSRKVRSSGGSSLAEVPGSSMEKMDPKSCAAQQQLQFRAAPCGVMRAKVTWT